jgi:hypothetical protein
MDRATLKRKRASLLERDSKKIRNQPGAFAFSLHFAPREIRMKETNITTPSVVSAVEMPRNGKANIELRSVTLQIIHRQCPDPDATNDTRIVTIPAPMRFQRRQKTMPQLLA